MSTVAWDALPGFSFNQAIRSQRVDRESGVETHLTYGRSCPTDRRKLGYHCRKHCRRDRPLHAFLRINKAPTRCARSWREAGGESPASSGISEGRGSYAEGRQAKLWAGWSTTDNT
jgi:hypothetical protein